MTNVMFIDILNQTEKYYDEMVLKFGACPNGVDWKSEDDQTHRFAQVSKIIETQNSFTVVDYGCGYGALISFLSRKYSDFKYTGYDVSNQMVNFAEQLFGASRGVEFINDSTINRPAQYCITSGTLNVKKQTSHETWLTYVKATLEMLDLNSTIGFSFNLLSADCDNDKRRDDLFYADEEQISLFCRDNFSKNVTVLRDYGLYEFTVLVKKA